MLTPLRSCVLSLVLGAGASAALGQLTETESNNTKALANTFSGVTSGQFITGTSTGSSTTAASPANADNFLISTGAAALGIYKHRVLVESEITGHTVSIRGLTQSATTGINLGSDAQVQLGSATTSPPRHVQWYGFGKQEAVYVRVTGTSSTTSAYTATLTTETVTPIDAGLFASGSVTIARSPGVSTDTDMWVYDATLTPIADGGIDDPETLTLNLTPGDYYVAYAPTNLANNQGASSGDTFRTGAVMDFPDSVVAGSNAPVASLPLRITDAYGPVDVPAARGAFEVVWVKFTVTNSPIAGGRCCLPDGGCMVAREGSCAILLGAYGGAGTDCVGANCIQPGGCCFGADYSCQVLSEGQCATAGGVYMGHGTACSACTPAPAGSVLIMAAESAANIADVKSKLESTGLFPVVISKVVQSTGASNPAPTPEYISQFDALLVWANNDFAPLDEAAMGNMLADYVDAGGGVVLTMFTFTSTDPDRQLAGRWDETYQIVPQGGGNTTGSAGVGIGTRDIPDHPILQGVNTFLGGTQDNRPTSTAFTSHGQRVAAWQDGKTLVAVSTTRPNRVDLGHHPVSTDQNSTGWDASTDGARLMANALLYTMTPACQGCGTQDFNGDGDFGTDQDIEAFFACLAGTCCESCFCGGQDFNNDGDFGTDQDIEAFFRVLAGSPC